MGRIVAQLVGGKKMEKLQAEMRNPYGNGRGETLLREVIYPGVEEQFARQVTFKRESVIPWPPTRPFGRVAPPAQTLTRSGRYRAAWTGGAGATSQVTSNTVRFGVDRSLFPQVVVFQSKKDTIVKAKKRNKSGRLSMQMKLGMEKGAWISEAKLLSGLVNHPRPIGISSDMQERGRKLIVREMIAASR